MDASDPVEELPAQPSFYKYLTEDNIFWTVIAVLWVVYLWDTYISYRQHKILKYEEKLPKELEGSMTQDLFDKARHYHLDKSSFSFWHDLWSQGFTTLVLIYNFIPLLWGWATDVNGYVSESWKSSEIYTTMTFMLVNSLLSLIINLPWSLYSTFVIEEKHGFNKQSMGFYFWDQLKKFIVGQIIMLPIVAAIVHIVKIGGDYFFVYLWLFCVIIIFLLMTVYPDYIAPLFDKFTPLSEGQLRTRIESLASSIEFPLTKIYIVEGSKRSSHSNAYFYGFFKNKRIVLFDTLLEKKEEPKSEETEAETKTDTDKGHKRTGCNDDEILAVLGHELGHWKLNHVLINLFISEANLFFCFSVFALLYRNSLLYAAFGFHHEMPVIIGFVIIFQYIFTPYQELLSFAMINLSRRLEFQADHFAKTLNLTANLKKALIKLNTDNLSFPIYDWLYSMCTNSHPPLLERIKALEKND